MDNELLAAFLGTLKETNATLLELVKITAHNQLAIKIIGIFVFLLAGGFVAWMFKHLDRIISMSEIITGGL